jgi:hypothetical protein
VRSEEKKVIGRKWDPKKTNKQTNKVTWREQIKNKFKNKSH